LAGAPVLAAPAPAVQHAEGINWQAGDVDAAFALARSSNKPLFLYWGAAWCPPCNQVKATIFKRQDFIERSRFFIAVYIDGDAPGAQKLGARFKVRGYPTMILFKPDGSEITRLPGEVDSERYLQVLALGMNASDSMQHRLAAALAADSPIGADDWRLLSFYSWDTDEQQLLAGQDMGKVLGQLADAAARSRAAGDSALRLRLHALVAAAVQPDARPGAGSAEVARLMPALNTPRIAHENMDILTNYAPELVSLLSAPATAERAQLASAFMTALHRLALDLTLSTTDRLNALDAQVAVARLQTPSGPLAPALLADVVARVQQAERATTDAYERQSVINAAAHTLGDAGLLDASDQLLTAELKRSHSPYYFMSSLAANAKKRGDTAAAVNWYGKAYDAATGPATRLQWGVGYINAMIDLAPQDEARIERAVHGVLTELAATPDAFYERNHTALSRMGKKLLAWNGGARHGAVLDRARAQLDAICSQLPAGDGQRASCQDVFKPLAR
jgi:thiol-disulfide isomerase/thioredoxin